MADLEGSQPHQHAARDTTRAVGHATLKPDNPPALDAAEHLTRKQLAQAKHIDRLAADADLVGLLRDEHFAGANYNYAAQELVRYGVAALTKWYLTGDIYPIMAKRGRGLGRPRSTITKDEARSLAGEVVTVALRHFRDDVLIPGIWTPTKGASLTTFFIGQCLLRLPNLHRAWLKELHDPFHDLPKREQITHGGHPPSVARDIEHDVLIELMSAEHLAMVKNNDARKALVYTAIGWTQAEIATELNTTEKAVERMLSYARTQVKKRKTA